MVVNGPTMYRNMMQPFGGHKLSGAGSHEGFVTLGEMMKQKTVILKNFLSR
jgi:succinate-semialdehyde dehydrogenase/glutarate-semialdehyde dehydrogenase